jgi:hypothetical protein
MGEFRKATDEARSLFAELTAGMDGERRPMFGCPCLFLRGNMVCGTYADRIFFRVPRELQAAVMKSTPAARLFEPMAGRPMKDYLELDAAEKLRSVITDLLASSWVQAQELPPKAKKGKKEA